MNTTDRTDSRTRAIGSAFALVVTILSLSACNTTDALTPQVDVGSGSSVGQSSPITQAETDRLAGSPSYASAPAQQQPVYSGGGPQNTLQAQAEALTRGQSSASAPLDDQAPPASPQADSANQAAPAQIASATAGEAGTVRFLPIIGAPLQAVTPLSRELGSQARARGLTIKSASDTSSEHILKGYFSAFSDSGKITIVYVWDVLDRNGGRLHRIQGQENVAGSSGEPWAAVPPSVMQQIAQRTMNEYMQWKQGQAG